MVGYHQAIGSPPPTMQQSSQRKIFSDEDDIVLFTEDYTDGIVNTVSNGTDDEFVDYIFEASSDDFEVTEDYLFEDVASEAAESDNYLFEDVGSEAEVASVSPKQEKGDLIAFTDDYVFDDSPVPTLKSSVSNAGIAICTDGTQCIPASLRPDGSTRKERQVKPGYCPPEDLKRYRAPSPAPVRGPIEDLSQPSESASTPLKNRDDLRCSHLALEEKSSSPISGHIQHIQHAQHPMITSSPATSLRSTNPLMQSRYAVSTGMSSTIAVRASNQSRQLSTLIQPEHTPSVFSNRPISIAPGTVQPTPQPTCKITTSASSSASWAQYYPSAPPALLDSSQPRQQLDVLRQISEGYFDPQIQVTKSKPNVQCTVTASTRHFGRIVAEGEGQKLDDAVRHAVGLFFSRLHADASLREVLPALTLSKINTADIEAKSHLVKLVYESTAKSGVVPLVTYEKIKSQYIQKSTSESVRVSIRSPVSNVQVWGQARSFRYAFILAAKEFLKVANRTNVPFKTGLTMLNAEALVKTKLANCTPEVEIGTPEDLIEIFHAQMKYRGQEIAPLVWGLSKREATQLAWLAAAVVLSLSTTNAPQAPVATTGHPPRRPVVYTHPVGPHVFQLATDMLRTLGPQPAPSRWNTKHANQSEDRDAQNRILGPSEIKTRNEELATHMKHLERKMENVKRFMDIKKKREELTINQNRQKVLELINNNECSILVAGTGSGKTTQLPQMLLEEAILNGNGARCNIVCTQPRRIAATSVARRVGVERDDGVLRSVGHQVRFDSNPPKPGGSINYCTTGIFLQMMQHAPSSSLDNVSHIIIDEAHERDINIDSLLALLKTEVGNRKSAGLKSPKIVLASATLDIDLFSKYFMQTTEDGSEHPAPHLEIEGRVFDVKHKYLGDVQKEIQKYGPGQTSMMTRDKTTEMFLKAERALGINSSLTPPSPTEQEMALIPLSLIALTIAHIVRKSKDGAILVFLPGLQEITKVQALLSSESPILEVDFDNDAKFKIIPLHSSLPDAQAEVFDSVPIGCRKIILSTNIAETSVTISDVKYVVDTGKHRKKMYDPKRSISDLQCVWISRSSAKQRAGRAGRVQDGHYYALYTEQRLEQFRATDLPEILCSDLQEVCLNVSALTHSYQIPVRAFLETWIEPPSSDAVQLSMTALKDMGALAEDEEITALGRVLSEFPVHPSLGKMVILGLIFRCLDPIIILAASFAMKDMFLKPIGVRKEAMDIRANFSGESNSDQLAVIKAFDQGRTYVEQWGEERARRWLTDRFIHFGGFRDIYRVAEQIEQLLVDQNLMPVTEIGSDYSLFGPKELNTNSKNEALVKGIMVAGFHPNLVAATSPKMMKGLHVDALMSNQSVNSIEKKEARPRGSLYTFAEMSKSADGKYMCRDTTAISPLMAMLFGRTLKRPRNDLLEVDGWLQFRLNSPHHADVFMRLKSTLDNVLGSAYVGLQTEVGKRRYLHANPVHTTLADQLAKLLDMDNQAYTEYLTERARFEAKYPHQGTRRVRGAR